MPEMNYNHLRYFWAVAHDGNLTRTAQRMNLSQSALSVQIKKLEDRLGHALFERRGRQLVLTETNLSVPPIFFLFSVPTTTRELMEDNS